MSRSSKRRENHRTSIVVDDDGGRRAEIVVALGSFESDPPLTLAGARRWFRRVGGHRAGPLSPSDDSASLVVDDFAFVLYVGPAETSGAHDGGEFRELAAAGRVDVYVVDGLDPRRARPDDFSVAASAGRLVAGAVRAYPVATLDTRS